MLFFLITLVEESSECCLPKLQQGFQSSVPQQPHSHVIKTQTGWMGCIVKGRFAGPVTRSNQ